VHAACFLSRTKIRERGDCLRVHSKRLLGLPLTAVDIGLRRTIDQRIELQISQDLAGLRTVGDVVSYIQKLEEENPEAAAALREKIEADRA
jgi:hypothetical protein